MWCLNNFHFKFSFVIMSVIALGEGYKLSLFLTNIVFGRCVMYSLKIHGLVTFMNCNVDNFSSLLIFVVSFFDVMVSKNYRPVLWNI